MKPLGTRVAPVETQRRLTLALERSDASVDLVADRAHVFEQLPGWVVKLPVARIQRSRVGYSGTDACRAGGPAARTACGDATRDGGTRFHRRGTNRSQRWRALPQPPGVGGGARRPPATPSPGRISPRRCPRSRYVPPAWGPRYASDGSDRVVGISHRCTSSWPMLRMRHVGRPVAAAIFTFGVASNGRMMTAPQSAHMYGPPVSRMFVPPQRLGPSGSKRTTALGVSYSARLRACGGCRTWWFRKRSMCVRGRAVTALDAHCRRTRESAPALVGREHASL